MFLGPLYLSATIPKNTNQLKFIVGHESLDTSLPIGNTDVHYHVLIGRVYLRDLDFGFDFLPVPSEMGEIWEFRCFSVDQNLNFQTKFVQILNFEKK
jgi:hypothetical protein